MGRGVLWGVLALLILSTAAAHDIGTGSSEQVVIRAIDGDLSTHTYTFACGMPDGITSPRTFSVRDTKTGTTVHEAQPGEQLTFTFDEPHIDGADQQDLWHIACQALDANDSNIRGDFHIDLRNETERTSAYPDRTNLVVTHAEDQSFDATCIPPQGSSATQAEWRIFQAHGSHDETFTGPLSISHDLSGPGLWDIVCTVDGSTWPVPVEFFESGPAYIPTESGCVPGEDCYLNDSDPDGPDEQVCYDSIQNIPVTCDGGTIDSDTYDGCRQVVCSDADSSLQALACHKNEGFEVYRQSMTGSGIEVCFGDACVGEWGFRSGELPFCTEGTPPEDNETDGNETDGGGDNETDDDPVVCDGTLADYPVTCSLGEITQDTYNGCRTIVCEDDAGFMQVLACPKDDGAFFEMYRQIQTGTSREICIADTCIEDRGFEKSDGTPVCEDDGTGDNETDGNETGTAPDAPVWFEPVPGQDDVEPFHFNLHVDEMNDPDGDAWVGTDYEIIDDASGELVWFADSIQNLHPRNGDGTFTGSLQGEDALLLDHPYTARARHVSSGEPALSDWSEVSFSTRGEFNDTIDSNWTWTATDGFKVELVAQDINLPVTLEPAPALYDHLPADQRPKLYMTQLYGQLGVLLQDGTYVQYADGLLNYEEFGSLPGSGEIGVIGLYADPATGDLFVSMSYMNDEDQLRGKVDRFVTDDTGTGFTERITILDGIPVSPAHQTQEITRGPDGYLYMGTGDADKPQTADDPDTLYGKILRFNDDGGELSVYAAGFRNPYGHEWRPGTDELFVSNNGEDSHDSMYRVLGGETFGWCQETCDTTAGAWTVWEETVVPTALAFDDGSSGFPADSQDDLYIVHVGPAYIEGQVDRGKRIVRIELNDAGEYVSESDFVTYTGDGLGTPLGLIFMDDGLYFTDMFGEDGFTAFGQTNGNIYRVVPGVQTEDPAPVDNELRGSFGAGRWYPQGLDMVWVCEGLGGSGDYRYTYLFGDGNAMHDTERTDVYYTYPEEGVYEASCIIEDLVTEQSVTLTSEIALGDATADDGTGDDDNQTDDNETDGDTNETDDNETDTGDVSVSLSIADWYPQGRDYIFVCEASGFTAETYDWDFGDGDVQLASTNDRVYHVYEEAGDYTVECSAHGEGTSASETLAISVT